MDVVAVLPPWARNTEVDQAMKCPSCRTRELVVINMVVKGEPITFRSCSSCDRRWWEGLDGPVELDAVLDQARSD
jgi:transcription elongation factor Elf1